MIDKYRGVYSPVAKEDLKSIYRYIAHDLLAPQAAKNQTDRIRKMIRGLDKFPEKHQGVDWEPWASMGMRQMPVNNYLVFYLVDKEEKQVTVVRIFYQGMDIENIAQENDV